MLIGVGFAFFLFVFWGGCLGDGRGGGKGGESGDEGADRGRWGFIVETRREPGGQWTEGRGGNEECRYIKDDEGAMG